MLPMSEDKQLIIELGGPTKVADLLRFDKTNGPQRVWNWMHRGIPSQVKLDHPEIFLRRKKQKST
jgi:hypothetical protein